MCYETRSAAERFIAHKTQTTSVLNDLKVDYPLCWMTGFDVNINSS
jgi:hypothetical protein